MDELLLPFQFAFMNKAFLIMMMLSVPTSLLSCYLVLKGWSLMGDAISHGVLPGIVLAYVLSIPLPIGAFVAGMFCAVATGFLSNNSRVKQDTVMGIVFSGMFGVGIVLYTKISTNLHLAQQQQQPWTLVLLEYHQLYLLSLQELFHRLLHQLHKLP